MKTRLVTAMLAAGLASCMVGPDYERPTIDTPTDWRIEYPEAADVANLK
jgi:multidrug efflux system outer membrane protein